MKKSRPIGVLSAAVSIFMFSLLAPSLAMAITISKDFGPFPDATWGGTGIPNDAVASSMKIVDGDVTITVAMNATGRFSNPVLGNDGAGTYFAGIGSNFGGAGQSTTEGALWNFNYFIRVEGANGVTPKLTDYQFDLFYDFDPADNTPIASLGKWDFTASIAAGASPAAALYEDSQNLMFGFLATSAPGFITAPGGVFDPNAIGNYQFALQVSSGGFTIDSVAIEVQTVSIPAAVWLFGSGLLGLVGLARRKRA